MSDKNLMMTLSLVDNASPKLKGFFDSLKAMEAKLQGMNTAFSGFNEKMAGLGKAADGAGSSFEKVMSTLSGMEGKVQAAAASMAKFGVATREAGSFARTASTDFEAAGSAIGSFETRLGSLGSTIKTVGLLWAAAKIGQGVEESVKAGSEVQDSTIRARNIGGTNLESQVQAAAAKAQAAVPQQKINELIKFGVDIFDASGKIEDLEYLEQTAKQLYVMKKSDATGNFGEKSGLDFMKSLEIRGAFMDDNKFASDSESMTKGTVATQGRVGPSEYFQFLKTLKAGENMDFAPEFWPTATALIQENGAKNAATMLNALQRTISGTTVKKELLPNWKDLNLLGDDGKTMKDYASFRDNPVKYIQDMIMPALKEHGVDMADHAQVASALGKLFGPQTAQEGAFQSIVKAPQIQKQAEVMNGAAGTDEAYKNISQTLSSTAETAGVALNNLEVVIGQKLGPVLIDALKWFTDFANGIKEDLADPTGDVLPLIEGAWEVLKEVIGGGVTFIEGVWAGLKDTIVSFGAIFMDQSDLTGNASVDWKITIAASVEFVSQALRNFIALMGIIVEGFVLGLNTMFTLASINFGSIGEFAKACAIAIAHVLSGDLSGAVSGFNASMSAIQANANTRFEALARSAEAAGARIAAAMAVIEGGPAPAGGSGKVDFGPHIDSWDPKPKAGGGAPHHSGGAGWNPPGGGKKGGGGGGKGRNADDIEANIDAENARFAREKLAIELKAVEQLYKDHQLSIDGFFSQKADSIKKSSDIEIAELQKQRAVLMKDPAYNADKINKVDHSIELAQMKEKQQLDDLDIEKKKALLSLNKEGLSVEAQLQSITKSASTAKIALLDQEYQEKMKLFAVNGQLAAAEELTALHAVQVAQVRYADNQRLVEQLAQVAKTTEMQATADAKAGRTTTAEATQQIVEAKRAQGEAELKILDAAMQYAETIKDPDLIERIKQMKIEAQGLADTLDNGAQKLKDSVGSGIESVLNDIMTGKFSAKKLADGLLGGISKEVSKGLSEQLTNGLFGSGPSGAGGMLSGLFGEGGSGNFLTALMGGNSFGKKSGGSLGSLSQIFGLAGSGGMSAMDMNGNGKVDPLAAASKLATDGLKSMTNDGVKAATNGLIDQVSKDALQTTTTQLATSALQQLAEAAMQAATSLGAGGGGGGGGGMGGLMSLFGGGGGDYAASLGTDGGFSSMLEGMAMFDTGADTIPRDMIAKIHKDEMILPAATASLVRNNRSQGNSGGGGGTQIINFKSDGPVDRRTQGQIASAAASKMQHAVRSTT